MPARVRARGSHRRPTSTKSKLAVGAVGAALVGVELLGAGPASAASDDFARLRQCESGGNYSINTGNGYYGAYQFNLGTWQGLGYSGLPSSASPATQDAAAITLQAQRGWSPWPSCSRQLGLYGRPSTSISVTSYRASTPARAPRVAFTSSSYRGQLFTTALVSQVRSDVRAWQARMASLGYRLTVDGQYGPQSASVCVAFEKARGLDVDSGVVGPQVWGAAFGR
jgi:hypothetical protein